MGKKLLEKLVRDRIPEIIERNGENPIIRTASKKEFLELLLAKLDEEVKELNEEQNINELSDILEVAFAIGSEIGISQEEIEKYRIKKRHLNGGFEKRIVLERVES